MQRSDMKKTTMAILLFDVMAGLFFLGLYGLRSTAVATDSGMVRIVEEGENLEPEDVKKIAITFDDGPHPSYTEQLLDGLKERGVHATFFVTGEHAELHPDIIERMSKEGHVIGNHTYSHMQLTKNNRDTFKEELIKTNEILKEITGEEVQYVRPPYGSWDKSFEKELNMFPVLWTVDPLDWSSRNVGRITEKIINKTRENDIILMHDYYDTSVTAALKAIDELMEEGYTFVTVEEILFD
nr:polysaccharide deacetylase family protein [uncultured Acetatifactor sp.]